jgi:hypothetical protein
MAQSVIAGANTVAYTSTLLLGASPDQRGDVEHQPQTAFNGPMIFQVSSIGPPGNLQEPPNVVDAIWGIGFSGSTLPYRKKSGIQGQTGNGVVGWGGLVAGTGVVGLGSNQPGGALGTGGIGVDGYGGIGDAEDFDAEDKPIPPEWPDAAGIGVRGTGGSTQGPNTLGTPHGPGVVGVGGGLAVTLTLAESGNVGVFGQGSVAKRVPAPDQPNSLDGPATQGIGVLGRGGTLEIPNGEIAPGPGVVGVAGGIQLPTGVVFDAGVVGYGETGPGGVFRSTKVAQLRLLPTLGSPPAAGLPGDIVVTIEQGVPDSAKIYMCVVGGSGQPGQIAMWRPFQLGALQPGM